MSELHKRIERLEREIGELKLLSLRRGRPKVKVSLKGALKGVKISERDIRRAKASLFPRSKPR